MKLIDCCRSFRWLTLGVSACAALFAAAGCAGRGEQAIPVGAKLVATGREGPVTFTADGPGTVYVLDDTDKKMVYRHDVVRGDRVTVVPNKDVIQLNAGTASEQKLDDNHQFQIHFDAAPTR